MEKFSNCPCTGMNFDKFIQPSILTILNKEEMHGYHIVQKLAENPMQHGRKPDPAGVYRFLKAMEQKGLVTASWDTPDSGQAKRLYRITPEGESCLVNWMVSMGQFHGSLGQLIREIEANVIAKAQTARQQAELNKGRISG